MGTQGRGSLHALLAPRLPPSHGLWPLPHPGSGYAFFQGLSVKRGVHEAGEDKVPKLQGAAARRKCCRNLGKLLTAPVYQSSLVSGLG